MKKLGSNASTGLYLTVPRESAQSVKVRVLFAASYPRFEEPGAKRYDRSGVPQLRLHRGDRLSDFAERIEMALRHAEGLFRQ